MKPSKFNILSTAQDDATKVLLYNTLHDHRILFDDPDVNPEVLFSKIKAGHALSPREREVVPELKEMGVLLEDEVNENEIFEEWYNAKIRQRTDLMQVTILPTMNCNLACDYCFENEVRENGLMDSTTIEKTIAWISRKMINVRPSKLHLTFFGGEPLLHPKAIRCISKALWPLAQSLGIEMEMGMITNGVLLTPTLVEELLPFGWKWIKITFDGDQEAHDKKRIHHNRKGTFDQIYNNLCAIKGKLKIAIGGNFDQANYESMFSLITRLRESPFADDIFVARFKPIMPVNPLIASGRAGKMTSFCDVCSFNEAQTRGMMALQDRVVEEGFESYERPDIGPCEFHSVHSVTIGPNGSIYKCPAFAGIDELTAGDVEFDDLSEQGKKQVALSKWDEDCEDCAYLPNCVGGCRYNSVNKTGSLEIKSCEGKHLEKATESYMQREILRLTQESREMGEPSSTH